MSRKTIPRETEKPKKLTRAQKKEIDAVIRKYKGDGKPRTAQATIPYEAIYPDGVCRIDRRTFSKCIAFEDISYQLAQPETYADPDLVAKLNREQKDLAPLVEAWQQYEKVQQDLAGLEELLEDPEYRPLAQAEQAQAQQDHIRIMGRGFQNSGLAIGRGQVAVVVGF